MSQIMLLFLTTLFLAGTFLLTTLSSALRSFHRKGSQKTLDALGSHFFYRSVHLKFFPENEHEGIYFAATCAQNTTRFLYVLFAVAFVYETDFFQQLSGHESSGLSTPIYYLWLIVSMVGFILLSFLIGDYIPRIWGTRNPVQSLAFSAPGSSVFLLFSFPITYLFLRFTRSISRTVYFDHLHAPDVLAKQEIIEIINKAEITEGLDETEKKLLSSLLSFCEHLTREVMVPRIDLFSLPSNITIKEAAKLLDQEGYSRVPVYEENVDNIVGILMYKDILSKYREYEQKGNDSKILEIPLSAIIKPALYTPETKKISDLLQEFRKEHMHIAIVVDEYGGTEGIITIEDILEDIVGEIADEYDVVEEFFVPLANGSWSVDPRMSLLDTEQQLGIKIPQEGDYDTIGGYIFHCAGEIPKRGFIIQSNDFELEVLKSNDRKVKKVRLTPLKTREAKEEYKLMEDSEEEL